MSSSNSSSKAKPSNGAWTVNAGLATWSAGTTTPNSSYNLTVPVDAQLFSVATPTTRTKEFSVSATLAQLGSGDTTSTFTGSARSEDKLRIRDSSGVPGSITDGLFANISSVEELDLQGSGGFAVTLGPNAQAAGIKEVEGSDAADRLDASAYTSARSIEIEGERGDDTLIGGQGNDKIEGGKGADQIDLQAGGVDRVKYESRTDGSAVGVAGTSFTGQDAITGFTSGDDKIDIDYSFQAVKFITEADGFDLTSVDGVVTAMNTAIAADALLAGRSVIFAINTSAASAVYSATVIDSDPLADGVQAVVSNPYLLATVNTPLVAGDVI